MSRSRVVTNFKVINPNTVSEPTPGEGHFHYYDGRRELLVDTRRELEVKLVLEATARFTVVE